MGAHVADVIAATTEDRVVREVERLLGGPLDGRRLAQVGSKLATLHERFVAEVPDDAAPRSYFGDRTSMAAYVAYFHPASVAQVRRALAEVAPPPGAMLRVLDLGAGPGSASVAVAEWAQSHGRRVEVVALETSTLALETLPRLFPSHAGSVTARAWTAGQPLPAGPFDVIVASHVLNELFPDDPARLDRRTKFALELAGLLSPSGRLVLLEPALRRTGRELLVLRDRLILQGKLSVLAPCLFQGACPAITRPRDWCHADRPWTPPSIVERVGDAANLVRGSLKFSYVVLSHEAPEAERTRDAALFRVVSEPLPEKGKLRYFGCGPSGRHPLVRLDRETSDTNARFSTLERGDLVRLGTTAASGDGKRIGATTSVECLVEARALDR